MTYNNRRSSEEQYAPRVAQYRASYAPSGMRPAESYRVAQMRAGLAVRFRPDYQLSGFWKECGSRVEFVSYDSAQGRRMLALLELLGMHVPVREDEPQE